MHDAVPTDWPSLPYADWEPTKQTLHRYTQIIGKVRMALTPPLNHWWHVTLLPATRGLTTGPMPYGDRYVEIVLDLVAHQVIVTSTDGRSSVLELTRRPACADVYEDLFAALAAMDVEVEIHAEPFDLGDSPPFAQDRVNDAYDADAVTRFWRVLASTERVLARFRSGFVGKASPVHLFWHSFDLAHARYSGRPAPVAPDADPVSAEAYSHEVIAFGFWPGDDRRTPFPAFYSYTAPEPAGLADRTLEPSAAYWQDTGSGSLAVLPYDAVRESADPAATLLAFYESAYLAGAQSAGWDLEQTARPVLPGRERDGAAEYISHPDVTVPPVSSYDSERSRVEVRADDELVAWVDLRPGGTSTIIAHTEVVPGHERQGLGQAAVRAAVEHIVGEGKSVIAVCPFARAVIASNPELGRA